MLNKPSFSVSKSGSLLSNSKFFSSIMPSIYIYRFDSLRKFNFMNVSKHIKKNWMTNLVKKNSK